MSSIQTRSHCYFFNPESSYAAREFLQLKKRVEQADAYVLGTPDYHGSVSSTLKNFLDHFWQEFTGKLFAQVVCSHEKGLTVIDQLRTVARQCYAWTLPYGLSFASSTDLKDGEIIAAALDERIKMFVHDLQVYGLVLRQQRRADLSSRYPGFLARIRETRGITSATDDVSLADVAQVPIANMKTEPIHTLILGAGTSGLAAGYALVKAGIKPVILEKDSVPGGLFRSIRRGDFIVDIGRKELYNRIVKVDTFWSDLLGSDYREYAHRGGILFNGHIIDMSPAFRGFRRRMQWSMLLGCGLDFFWSRAQPGKPAPRNVEEYFYQKRGRQLTRIAAQGFQEKLNGTRWADVLLANDYANGEDASFFSTIKSLATRIVSNKEVNTYKGIWRHPAKGTGQICEKLAEEILKAGATIHYKAQVREMTCAADDGRQMAEDRKQRIDTVAARIGSETICFRPSHVVSSIPPKLLKRFLSANSSGPSPVVRPQSSLPGALSSVASAPKRTVVLVYLFLNEEPRFPHAWLQVTCPSTRIGRITNYAAFSPDMVPKGKTCLCCEMYCFGPDKLLEMDDASIAKLARDDCARSGLVDPARYFDHLVLRLPGADASQNRDNWMSPSRLKLLGELEQFKNLYYVNRTETDIATLAGLEAVEAILSGDRSHFDRRIDPAELGIRSESKAFEFQLPVASDL